MEEGEIQAEPQAKIERWNYENRFREYMLLLARKGKDGLEFSSNFPKKIELNSVWHETLNKMREETKDGHERFALIGFREDMKDIVLPSVFGKGERSTIENGFRANVPAGVMTKEIQKAKDKTGLKGLVGDIHSHPQSVSEGIIKRLFGSISFPGVHGDGGFSAGDLYRMVIPEEFLPMIGLVDGDQNFFVFKTRQSRDIPTSSKYFSQDSFEEYWYRKCGRIPVGNVGIKVSPTYSTLEMNRKIAERHNLVLYKGKPGKDIVRLYPH